MSQPKELKIPVGMDLSPLGKDLKQAHEDVSGFALAAARPVLPRLDLSRLRVDAAHAREIAGHIAQHAAVEHLASRAAPALMHATQAPMIAKSAIDSQVGNAANLTITVSQAALKAGLSTAKALVRADVAIMKQIAKLPITVTSIGVKVGMALAQAAVFAGIKKVTGISTIKLLITYAAFRVGLKVATTLVRTAVRTMTRIAFVPIRVGLSGLRSGLSTAGSLISTAIGMASPLGVAAAGAGLVATAVGAIGGAVYAASNLNEAVSKVGYSFGESSSIVIKGADEMASKFGASKKEFLDGASAIGLIGKASGMADAEAAKLGVNFTKLAADVASFHNLSFDESLAKIRSGLVGEAEPLRTVGVLLSENAVKAQAAKMGFEAVDGQLSEGDKVKARAVLITTQLASATGDLARTQASFANRIRELRGRIGNLAADMGTFLLPAVESISSAFATLAVGASAAIERNRATFEAWGAKLKAVADGVGVLFRNFKEFAAIAALVWKDLGGNVWEALKTAFTNANNYAVYFAGTLGFEVEKAVTNALHAALKGTRWDPGAFDGFDNRIAPELAKPNFKVDLGVEAAMNRIKAAELFERLKPAIGDAAGRLKNFAMVLNGANSAVVADVAVKTKAQAKAEKAADRAAVKAANAAKARHNAAISAMKPGEFHNQTMIQGALGMGIGGAMSIPAMLADVAPKKSAEWLKEALFGKEPPRHAGAYQMGSQEAYSAVLKASNHQGDESVKTIAKQGKDQVMFQGRMADSLDQIVRLLPNGQTAPQVFSIN